MEPHEDSEEHLDESDESHSEESDSHESDSHESDEHSEEDEEEHHEKLYDVEARLMEHVLSHASRNVPPIAKLREPVKIQYGMALQSIKEFGDIKNIRVPYYRIWTPDVFLYNSASPAKLIE